MWKIVSKKLRMISINLADTWLDHRKFLAITHIQSLKNTILKINLTRPKPAEKE